MRIKGLTSPCDIWDQMSHEFLSYDCASKTLGYTHVIIDTHIYSKIAILETELNEFLTLHLGRGYILKNNCEFAMLLHDNEFYSMIVFFIELLYYYLQNFIQYRNAGVVDTLDGARVNETDEITRTRLLKTYLQNTAQISPDATVLIEAQPPKIGSKTNNKSTMVAHQLAFYYIDKNVHFVPPKLKNQIALHDDLTRDVILANVLAQKNTIEKVAKRKTIQTSRDVKYIVNKLHSKLNFLHLINAFELQHVIEYTRNDVMDDLADSTMQILAYLVKNKLFI